MTKRQKHDAFRLAFDKFEAAHKSVLDLDRKKLMAAKVAGEALSQMRLAKGCTVEQLIATLDGLGITISQDTLNRYVKVASRWDEIVAIAKQRQIDLMALGYVEALGLLPLSEHAQKVKAGKQRPKVATTMEEPGWLRRNRPPIGREGSSHSTASNLPRLPRRLFQRNRTRTMPGATTPVSRSFMRSS